ncbi:hypothetical protein HQ520_08030 [bacterium]|nr:hypothetical protein [bacterium]
MSWDEPVEPWPSLSTDALLPALQLQRRLRHQGVDEALVQRILGRMYFAARRVDAVPWKPGEEPACSPDAEGTFGRFVQVVGDFVPRSGDRPYWSGARQVALIGPTGVGKTTTIAKIASYHALRRNHRVALLTLDTYRIAAAEQLRTYARLLGVPVEVVSDPSGLPEALSRFPDADLILVDTPGCSPGDQQAIQRLAAGLKACPGLDVQLVVPSGLREGEMERVLTNFRPLQFEKVVFSKLDEAVSWGDLLNAWVLKDLEVSYFTTGQRVPEDLEPATVEGLCRALLSEEVSSDKERRESGHRVAVSVA